VAAIMSAGAASGLPPQTCTKEITMDYQEFICLPREQKDRLLWEVIQNNGVSRVNPLIRQPALCQWLDLSRSGLEKLRKNDPSFPRPIKHGDSQQAICSYVVAEVEAWLKAKIERRDAQP
jgi:prophage regulatory protein